jgi:hypothetical protein
MKLTGERAIRNAATVWFGTTLEPGAAAACIINVWVCMPAAQRARINSAQRDCVICAYSE